jgi:hypothetical protein
MRTPKARPELDVDAGLQSTPTGELRREPHSYHVILSTRTANRAVGVERAVEFKLWLFLSVDGPA